MKRLRILDEEQERTALQARWPDVVLALTGAERAARVREGQESVMLHDVDTAGGAVRGFVRAVLTVPLGHPKGSVYGVFVEVDRAGYAELQRAFRDKKAARVWGRLATKLPYLEDAFEAEVCLLEDGGEMRARVVEVKSDVLRDGPRVGRR